MHNIVTVVRCKEKNKSVVREVRVLDKTPEQVLSIYDKICGCKASTGWERPLTLERFLGPKSVIWTVDDVGVLVLIFDEVPHVHAVFWDRRLRGREKLCRLAIYAVMKQFNLPEVWTAIPAGLTMIQQFARRIGFNAQTITRGFVWSRMNIHDLHLAAGRDT